MPTSIYDSGVGSVTTRRRVLVVALGTALGVLIQAPAFGNGRFPEAQRLLEHPGNPDRLYMAATFGLLVTEDRGRNWYTICEESFAKKFLEGDPVLEVLGDGALLAGIFDTLNRSSDCGCTWDTTLGAADTETVLDITIDRSTGAVIALVQDLSTFPGRLSLSESADLGRTWRKLSDIPAEIVDAYTVDVAPSDSNRIYVSGMPRFEQGIPTVGLLGVSNDHGASWQTRSIVGTAGNAYPYIAAIDPTRPDRLFVRTDTWDDSAEFAANDALLYSEDGGRSWRELVRRAAKLFGFALSPDGSTVLVGYGDPVQAGGRTANSEDFGIYKASTSQLTFEKIYLAAISCLRWTGSGLYACITENHPELPTPGLGLGFSADASFTLTTANPFTSLLSVKNVRGPLACNASVCLDNWQTGMKDVAPLCQLLEASCDVEVSGNALSCPISTDAGINDGMAGAGGTGGSGAGGRAGTTGTAGTSGGCGCSVAVEGPSYPLGALAALGLWAAFRPRRSPAREGRKRAAS